jgi:hypothetical protein
MASHENISETVPVPVVNVAAPPDCSAHQAVTSFADLHHHKCWAAYLGRPLDDDSQKLLAKLLLLSNELKYVDGNAEQSRLLQLVLFACDSIATDRNTVVAKVIHEDVTNILLLRRKHREKWRFTVHRFFASSNSQRTYIGLGLLLFLIAAVILSLLVDIAQVAKVASIPSEIFTTAILFGTLGSSLSIMLRFNEQKPHRRNIPSVDLFVVGFSKPIIGAVLALVLFAVYKARVVSLIAIADAAREPYFLIVLFFLAGFSERFVGDILSRIDGGEGGQGTEQNAHNHRLAAT